MKLNTDCDNTLTAREKTSDPSGPKQETTTTVAAMQNSPTANSKKNCLRAFFESLAVKIGHKVSPLQPVSDTDLADPQPGPSGLEPTNCDANPADPEPAEEKQSKMKKMKKGVRKFFKRLWRSGKDPAVIETTALQDPTDPPEDPQPGSSVHDRDPAASMITPDVGPRGQHDPANPLPGPSGPVPRFLKCTGASKLGLLGGPTRFRTTSSPGPSTFPFSRLYELGEQIGHGSFGTVYEGIMKFTREPVAIKVIIKNVLDDRYISIPGCPKPLLAEVALNLLLNQPPVSPYIVHMLDWFEEKDRYILILEHPEPCEDLLRYFVSNGMRLNESVASDLMYQAVLGAKHCFDRGVFHRDIKLNNFLINTATNQVKIIDFGCGDLIKSSYSHEFQGACRPPEYFNCLRFEAGPTTVWSLGVMMFRMICGRQPFTHLHDMNYGTLTFNSGVSRECQDLISRCLTRDPTKRATIKEILQHEWFQRGEMSRVAQESGQTTQHISDPEVLPTVEEPITAHPEIEDDDIIHDCVCDPSEWNVDVVHALNSVTCDIHVNTLDLNAPELPVSAVSDCKVDVSQASDGSAEDTVAPQSSLDNGFQDYTEHLPLELQHQHSEDKERDGASDKETKPDYRVPEVPIPANDTPDFLSKVISGLSTHWVTLAMISFIFITIYQPKVLMMSVLCVQIRCFHEMIRIGNIVYLCYHIPWFRTLSLYFLLCVIHFFYGEKVMDYFFTPVQREEDIHMLSKYPPFISSALYLAGFCMLVLSLVKKRFRQPFYMFACTHVILLNVAIHSSLIIRGPYEWMTWFIVPISCVICNNILAYVFGFFSGSTPLI